jgi:dolichol kinase
MRIGCLHSTALLVLPLAEITSKIVALIALVTITAIYAGSETVRLTGGNVPIITAFTLRMSSGSEEHHFISRPVFLATGVSLALLSFPKEVSYASIIIVALGDPIASYIGTKIGRLRFRRKSLEGFAAGLIASALAASLVISPLLSLIGATAGMSMELSGVFEDNLTIPLASGALILLAKSFLPTV